MRRKTKAVTIKEVADRAKVSVATVSRVLNNSIQVKGHLKRSVDQAIQELGYQYQPPAAAGRKAREPARIGIVLPNIGNPYFSLLIAGISNSAVVSGAEILLFNSDENIETETRHFTRIAHSNVQGVIYIPFAKKVDSFVFELMEKKFPLVFLDRELENGETCFVGSNNVEGAYQATTYLLDLGHRDIVFISGPLHLSTSTARFEGYSRGLAEFGLKVRKELVLYGDTTYEGGLREMKKFLSQKVKFSAVFGSDDRMATGARRAVVEAGLTVPEDVSIIGYDNIPFSEYMELTTIAQPSYELGRNALILLMELIEHRRRPPQRILLRDSLIIRKSCRKV